MFAKISLSVLQQCYLHGSLAWGSRCSCCEDEGSEVPWEQMITAGVCTTSVILISLDFFSEMYC